MSIKDFSMEFLKNLSLGAAALPRGRKTFNLHQDYRDPCQRLFNAIGVNSYIPPHRHSLDPKVETLIAIKGLFALIIFDEVGGIKEISKFGTEKFLEIGVTSIGVELTPNVWHTVLALMENSTLLEIKAGPFQPAIAKEIAPWAPEENTEEATIYFLGLKEQISSASCMRYLRKSRIPKFVI